jgi:hypothetical protein
LERFTIRAKIVGRRAVGFTPLEIECEQPFSTCRGLLTAIVRQQIAAFRQRKELAHFLRVLTETEIDEGREAGRILAGVPEPEADGRVPDAEHAIDTAITAFQDGLYFIFINDVQNESLDLPIAAGEVRDVLFVRLTPLVGG